MQTVLCGNSFTADTLTMVGGWKSKSENQFLNGFDGAIKAYFHINFLSMQSDCYGSHLEFRI